MKARRPMSMRRTATRPAAGRETFHRPAPPPPKNEATVNNIIPAYIAATSAFLNFSLPGAATRHAIQRSAIPVQHLVILEVWPRGRRLQRTHAPKLATSRVYGRDRGTHTNALAQTQLKLGSGLTSKLGGAGLRADPQTRKQLKLGRADRQSRWRLCAA